MSKEWTYVSGDWWLLCDVCNKKIHASESKHRWDGFIVCCNCFEQRHPQDFVRTKNDKISVPFSRPRTEDEFINLCTYAGSSGVAGFAVAGCMRPSYPYVPSADTPVPPSSFPTP